MRWSRKTNLSKEIIISGELDSNLANEVQLILFEVNKLNHEIMSMLAEHTNKTRSEIDSAINQAGGILWMNAEEAKTFGIIDKIID